MSTRYRVGSLITRSACVAGAVTIAAGLLATTVDARPGSGGSSGSRGSRTYSAPPSTQTAPGMTAPMQRSTQPQVAPRTPGSIARPVAAPAAASRGFGSLLMGGLLGAGLFGLLSGAGLFGGMSGMAGMLGLLLQIGLIGGIIWLGMSFFRRRQQSQLAGATAGGMFSNTSTRAPVDMSAASAPLQRMSMNPNAGGSSNMAGAVPTVPLKITGDDFNAFEALLGTIQSSYGVGDRTALAGRVSPEMMSYFGDELADNERRGVRNEVSDAKLLQGDLSESWTEEGKWDYASVAMRYSLIDAKVDVKTGRVVDGSRTEPQEVTEVWTFLRPRGTTAANWRLSAIQQVQ